MDTNSASVNQNFNRDEFVDALAQANMRLKLCGPSFSEMLRALPGLGVEISHNETAKWWQPFVVVSVGRRILQFGWLYDTDGSECP